MFAEAEYKLYYIIFSYTNLISFEKFHINVQRQISYDKNDDNTNVIIIFTLQYI